MTLNLSSNTLTFALVKQAINLDAFDTAAAQLHMSPRPRARLSQFDGVDAREAAVLALIYPETRGLHLILTRRTEHLRGHSGQISFPGGRCDPEDGSYTHTALRETEEELGVTNDQIDVIGDLASFYIPPSNYNVYPSVGFTAQKPHFKPNPDEVAEVITFPLVDLLDPRIKHEEERDFQGFKVQIPYYDIQGHKVWGATAVMLSEIEHRLRAVI